MITSQKERIELSSTIMEAFARRTGLKDPETPANRYLWTDAFAVCNFLTLFERIGETRYLDQARNLVDAVHRELGRYHAGDVRSGTISGLSEPDAANYPTVGGLRIGKALSERGPDEPYDEVLEWDRDGQYFHYLTKWMHALDQMATVSGEVRYSRWAVELAKTAHRAFTYTLPDGTQRMYWKMSTDLSRPLVPSMGQHDALDAYVTYLQLSVTAASFGDDAGLKEELESAAAMAEAMALFTEDPLGIGGLLTDAARVMQLMTWHALPLRGLLRSLLEAAQNGLGRFAQSETLRYPASHRLAFRELGLGIGLHGIALMEALNTSQLKNAVLAEQLDGLQVFVPLAEALERFWVSEAHQNVPTWGEHEEINSVMLATSLLPDRFLILENASVKEPT